MIKADEKSKHVAGEEWHTDVSCDVEPPMGSILYLTEVPPDGGGDTLFANMYRAYETLSEPIKQMLQGLTALHDSSKAHYYRVKATDRDDIKFPNAEHPIVRTHPVTGKQGLYVNRGFTLRIPQLAGTRATRCSRCSTATSRRRSSSAASSGRPTRWRSGTIAAPSTTRCSTTIRTAATAIA